MRLRVLFGVKIPVTKVFGTTIIRYLDCIWYHDLVSTIWYPRWSHLRRYGLQALVVAGTAFRPSLYLRNNQLTSLQAGFGRLRCRWAPLHHPVAGGSWFVGHSCGTRENGCLSFRALRTERCPRFPAVFACITPRAACATCIQPYRACRSLENHVRSGKKNSQPLWDISKLSSQIA